LTLNAIQKLSVAARILMLVAASNCLAQRDGSPPRVPALDSGTRERILDAAFPSDARAAAAGKVSISIRFLPSFHPESQLFLLVRHGSPAQVRYLKAAVSLEEAAGHAKSGEAVDVQDAVARMHVQGTAYVESADFSDEVLRDLWKAIAESSTQLSARMSAGTLQLDGTLYSLTLRSGLDSFSLNLTGGEVGSVTRRDPPVVHWMEALRLAAEPRLRTR